MHGEANGGVKEIIIIQDAKWHIPTKKLKPSKLYMYLRTF